ncbi:hypothetical protein SAPIO_CDS10378 [Scedosporium apiospermum]|uniref:Gylcosyl hydrolase 115 C-terminal domain-containing protein n=1 Tax=Pseudallescheria apiosperma TaxID=563466 RepID=A0A084FV99_PSEDA|nr:uncharacterized protein SAPIO_CDS10378 [Scedosporium apiospermum]KEZ39011.1 hypothetical protein SAPIO_CDS10378 [Scedosporium apiospermum]
MKLLPRAAALAAAFFSLPALAIFEETLVEFRPSSSSIDITTAPIVLSSDDWTGVHIAGGSLSTDLEAITELSRDVLSYSVDEAEEYLADLTSVILTGSADSALIRSLVDAELLDISDIEGKWESFKTVVVDAPFPGVESALVIAGSDKRGTIFGIHTLAEQCGQSPFHWFSDVPPKKHAQVFALRKTTTQGEPSVKYRGLFINDEEPALNTWWAKYNNQTRYPLNTEFYAHVFDLLLRLKANYLWPAMWKSWTPPPGNIFFTDDPGNQQLADDYGIVISTAHHEPMQRATNEWDEAVMGPWDWSKNRDNITEFMEAGIERAGNNESYFTIGLRGLGDEAANTENAIEMLKDVFDVQRGIIEKYHGSPDAVNQVWALYKEVASYYDAGLDPPEDVTLLFPDDNWGNVYRLPTGDEASRKGGSGVYYHFEYVGLPRSYKWANTNNLAKVLKELMHSYLRGADRIWIVNVGDIKPMEIPFAFAMDLAWNVSNFSFERIPTYLKLLATRDFGADFADEIADILLEHSHLIGMRRFELVTSGTFSTLNYHEAERVLGRWKSLAERAKVVYEQLDTQTQPAFYQLVYHPVASGTIYYSVMVGVGTNYKYALERRNSANTVARQVLDDFDASYDMVEEYDAMLGGKWANMMSQAVYDAAWQEPKSWAGPARDMLANLSFVQLRQDMQFSLGNLGIYAEGSTSPIEQGRWAESVDSSMPTTGYTALLPQMDRFGPRVRYIDLFARGDYRVPIDWELEEIPVDFISISPARGTLNRDKPDERLNVTIDWSLVPDDFDDTVNIGITSTPSRYPYFDLIRIPVVNTQVPADFKGFPETAGMIAIEAPHFQRSSAITHKKKDEQDPTVNFSVFPHLGSRSESGSIGLRPFAEARQVDNAATSAWVEYDIYLFSDAEAVEATVYINGCLDTDPRLRMQFSLTLGDAPANFTRVLGDYITNPYAGDIPPEWLDHVADQVWTKKVDLGGLEAGKHTLRWAANSPEVYLEKIVLNTRGGVKETYLGPPETRLVE